MAGIKVKRLEICVPGSFMLQILTVLVLTNSLASTFTLDNLVPQPSSVAVSSRRRVSSSMFSAGTLR